jgi:hypothetical protein
MDENNKCEFRLCDCGSPIIHGHLHFDELGRQSCAITSLPEAREVLEYGVEIELISRDAVEGLLQVIADSGITEEGPDEATREAHAKMVVDSIDSLPDLLAFLAATSSGVVVLGLPDFDVDEHEDDFEE